MERLIRVFPRRTNHTPTDAYAIVGYDDSIIKNINRNIPVHVSVTFTWDKKEGYILKALYEKHFKNVQIGGQAFDQSSSYKFYPGRYIREGAVFTSKGCNRGCPWCYEGYGLKEIDDIASGWIIWDPNLLACSKSHIVKVFDMLRMQEHNRIIFAGGLDLRLFKEWHLELLESIKIKRLYFAIDSSSVIPDAKRVSKLIHQKPKNWKYAYMLCAYNGETIEHAQNRIKQAIDLGFTPQVTLYQCDKWIHYSPGWLDLKNEYDIQDCFDGR